MKTYFSIIALLFILFSSTFIIADKVMQKSKRFETNRLYLAHFNREIKNQFSEILTDSHKSKKNENIWAHFGFKNLYNFYSKQIVLSIDLNLFDDKHNKEIIEKILTAVRSKYISSSYNFFDLKFTQMEILIFFQRTEYLYKVDTINKTIKLEKTGTW